MIFLLACATAFEKVAPPRLDVQVTDLDVVAGPDGLAGTAYLSMSSDGSVSTVRLDAVDLEDESLDAVDTDEVDDAEHALPWDHVYEWSMASIECGGTAHFRFQIETDVGTWGVPADALVTCGE